MSQKSSVPQLDSSVSQLLKRDTLAECTLGGYIGVAVDEDRIDLVARISVARTALHPVEEKILGITRPSTSNTATATKPISAVKLPN